MAYASGSIIKRGSAYTLKASAAEGTSTTHPAIDTGASAVLCLVVDVTAKSGTNPTLTVVVEGSDDGGTTWFTLGTIGSDGYSAGTTATAPSNFTDVATTRAAFPAVQMVRTRSVVGGTSTPTLTYSINASAS